MYATIYLLAGATTAIIALVALWAARSSLHWFWRAAALLTCFVLLVPIGAVELNLLYAPMAGILFLASTGQQWWERRRQRHSLSSGDHEQGRESIRADDSPLALNSGPNRRRAPSVRISLKELFLVVLLAAVAAWVAARIVQEGIVIDWRKLPIALTLVTAVAWIAATWGDKPRMWQPFWAKTAAYLIGLAMILPSINALIYVFQLESATDIVIGAASVVCLVMVITDVWLKYVGRMPQTLLLAGAIYAASYIHANILGDWLSADFLLIEEKPTFWLLQRIIYGLLYFSVAVFVLLGVLLWRGAALPARESSRNLILSRLSMAGLVAVLLPLAWFYCRLLAVPQISKAKSGLAVGSLADANKIVERIQGERKAAPSTMPATLMGPALPDSPEMRRLTKELFAALEMPGKVQRPVIPEKPSSMQIQVDERSRLLNLATQVFGLGQSREPPVGNPDENSEFSLAQVRYAILLQREGLAIDAKGAYWVEQFGHMHLAMQHDDLSSARRRELLQAIVELDRTREPLEAMLSRDTAWSERNERWRSRLRRVVLGRDNSVDTGTRAFDTVRERHHACVATARMNMTYIAIHLFEQDQGRLPSSLQELVPRYLESVPSDPYSDQPLVYRPSKGRFALYSVWSDGNDDGGVNVFDYNFEDSVKGMRAQIARVQAAAKALARAPAKAPPAAASGGKSPAPANP